MTESFGSSSSSSSNSSQSPNLNKQRHTLLDIPVTELMGVYECPEEILSPTDQWKAMQKTLSVEASEDEEFTRCIKEQLDQENEKKLKFESRIKVRIEGGFLYCISTPFNCEIGSILKRFVWEVGKRKAMDCASKNIDVQEDRYGVEIVYTL